MLSIKERLKIAVLTEPGKSWPTFDGKELKRYDYVTASEASKCVRQLAFEKKADMNTVAVPDYWDSMSDEDFAIRLEALKDDNVLGIFARGNWMELWIVEQLLATLGDGEDYMFLGDDQVSFYSDKRKVSGTPDGLYINWTDMTYRWLEFKSSQNPISAPKAAHLRQLGVNMGLFEALKQSGKLDGIFDVPFESMTLEGGNLVYVNSDNYLTIAEFPVEWDNGEEYAHACAKAQALFVKRNGAVTLREPEELEPEGLSSNWGCSFCAYKSQCYEIEQERKHKVSSDKLRALIDRQMGGKTKLPSMPSFAAGAKEKQQVVEVLLSYSNYDQEEKMAKSHKDSLRGTIMAFLDAQDGGKVEFQDDDTLFKASISVSEREGSIDAKKLEEFLKDHGAEVKQFRKAGSTVKTLRVTVEPVGE